MGGAGDPALCVPASVLGHTREDGGGCRNTRTVEADVACRCKAVPPSEGKWLRSCCHPWVFREMSEHSKEREPPVDDISRGVTLGLRSQGRASHAGSQAVPVTESCTQAM